MNEGLIPWLENELHYKITQRSSFSKGYYHALEKCLAKVREAEKELYQKFHTILDDYGEMDMDDIHKIINKIFNAQSDGETQA